MTESAQGARFRRTLVAVLTVEAVTMILLGVLQAAFSR
jgi:hypothetical protein